MRENGSIEWRSDKKWHIKALLASLVVLALCISCLAVAEQPAESYIGKLYPEMDGLKIIAENRQLEVSDKFKCTVLETALMGDQLIQAVRLEPVGEGVFLYPVDSMLPPDQDLAFSYLSAVIGDNLLMQGFAENDQGKTMSAYLETVNKTPYWIRFHLATQPSVENERLQNRWYLQEDGSLITVASVSPVQSDTEYTMVVLFAGYVENTDGQLEKDGAETKDAAVVGYSLTIDGK